MSTIDVWHAVGLLAQARKAAEAHAAYVAAYERHVGDWRKPTGKPTSGQEWDRDVAPIMQQSNADDQLLRKAMTVAFGVCAW
jgi:hypothetical protein